MNTRRFSWLTVTFALLVCSQTLTAQVPESTYPYNGSTGVTAQQPFVTTPIRPSATLFYSDMNNSTATEQPYQNVDQAPLPTVGQLVNQASSDSPSDASQSPKQTPKQTPKQKGKFCHSMNLWGEFLYLRPRNAEVVYAVDANSAIAPPGVPIQTAPLGMVDQEYEPAFSVGLTYTLDDCSSLTASWTMFESHNLTRIDRSSITNVIQSSVMHPSSVAASSSGTFAVGSHDIDFDIVNLEYRGLLDATDRSELNYVVGIRYLYLQQEFFTNTDINGSETVATDIDFNGVGIRLGLEGERFRHKSRCFFYGKTYVNFLAGEANAKLDQGQAFDSSVVDTLWEAGRIVSMYDLELGFGHVSKSGCCSWNVGYSFSAWTNVVKTDEFINAVQTNNFLELGDFMTFDGLVARLEGRF